MSEQLRLPEVFRGSWENLLVLTFGADLPFFENAILRSEFTCRNKIILVDGREFLGACARYATEGKVRLLNQIYIAEGIHVPNAAHAKIILLTRHDEGKLYVGSGNLGIQGYTSGGETFTSYHFTNKEQNSLPAFRAVWELVEILLRRGAIGAAAENNLRKIYEDTPWLMHRPVDGWRPVRHNLETSLLEQLREEMGYEKVEELWVVAPFFDEKVAALARLIDVFEPTETHVLIQPKRVSVEKSALQRLIARYPHIAIHPFHKLGGDDTVYAHAKFYLIKTKKRAVCLQGSANCSQAALLLHSPKGNIEVANLLTGARDAFDDLLEPLDFGAAVKDLRSLELTYERPDTAERGLNQEWLLTGARWYDDSLVLHFHETAPDLQGAQLRVGNIKFRVTIRRREGRMVEVELPSDAAEQLASGPCPLWLEIGEVLSSPVFPHDVDQLSREAREARPEGFVRDMKNLNPDDPEFENLLRELEASLPLDRRSIWELAGRVAPAVADGENDDALRLAYADIDYDLLRRHPKIQQYTRDRSLADSANAPTRLQQILSAITAHFQGLVDVAYHRQSTNLLPVVEVPEEEISQEDVEEESEKVQRSRQRRVAGILRRFLKRYLHGLQSKDFVDLVGADVIVNNYIIFSHILWRLMQLEWVELDFVLESAANMFRFFWGHAISTGYFASLSSDDRGRALEALHAQKNAALLMAMLYYGDRECSIEGWLDIRLTLRDFWRHFLAQMYMALEAQDLLSAWVYLHEALPSAFPTPGHVASSLRTLAQVETNDEFLTQLEKKLGLLENSCGLVRETVYRESSGQKIDVDCLHIGDNAPIPTMEQSAEILQMWMRYTQQDFFRIIGRGFILVYDAATRAGSFYDKLTKESKDFTDIPAPASENWQAAANHLVTVSKQADRDVSLVRAEVTTPV